ncbi:MAG: alkaline phosphatase family protein [Acidobacteriaceae bacterium]|nr:alkaline phosphatase family protein [Acidobacteriaceae bacterium]
MKRLLAFFAVAGGLAVGACAQTSALNPAARRLVILKVDGLNADLLYRTMRERDPATGKSRLPWFSHIFGENGAEFENFYTRGISLSAPSWSMLDTGRHAIIRGNVEYDRYTGYVYDYLNFFPFYIGYARKREVDMPGVEVLDRAGIPLLIDRFQYPQVLQSFQLYQRGVSWVSLKHALERRFSSKFLFATVESTGAPTMDEVLAQQTEHDLLNGLKQSRILYLDFYTGDIDHEGHATNQPAALFFVMRRLDALAGRLWTAIQDSGLAAQTLFVAVSDHGMNNEPDVFSQSFSLPDLLNSPEGGGHHVLTNRHQLQEFKISGLDPLVRRVITPSTASLYLAGQSSQYPTAWLDLDGNERAAAHLRNSDLNKLHILLLQLSRSGLAPALRAAAAECVDETIGRHRSAWTRTASELDEELRALQEAIEQRKSTVAQEPRNRTATQQDRGEDKAARRQREELQSWERERAEYASYLAHLRALLAFRADRDQPFRGSITRLIAENSLGDNNTIRDLQHYIVGPAAGGLVLDASGKLDEARSFRFVDYFSLLVSQRVRNNPQAALSAQPIDFVAARLPDAGLTSESDACRHAYWLYGGPRKQLLILTGSEGQIAVRPVRDLSEDADGKIRASPLNWEAGLPLRLFEDSELNLPPGIGRSAWLSAWHTESEWMEAIHRCRYSNGVIGVIEELSPVEDNVPGPSGLAPLLLRYERRRRELVQPDFHVFAADHWNFNVRNFNPGGNHGAFFRISTHSIWLMAGAGVPHQRIDKPYDSLNFASTLLSLLGFAPPIPDRVVQIK